MNVKINKTLLLALSFSLVLVLSCKKKSNSSSSNTPITTTGTTTGSTTGNTVNGSMTALLNGASWVSTKNTAALSIDNDINASGLVINGETTNEYFVFGIDFPGTSQTLSTGIHDVGGNLDDIVFIYTIKKPGGGTVIQHNCDEGEINLTAVDNVNKKFSGTFHFKLHKIGSTASADSIKITNGVFTNIAFAIVNQ